MPNYAPQQIQIPSPQLPNVQARQNPAPAPMMPQSSGMPDIGSILQMLKLKQMMQQKQGADSMKGGTPGGGTPQMSPAPIAPPAIQAPAPAIPAGPMSPAPQQVPSIGDLLFKQSFGGGLS